MQAINPKKNPNYVHIDEIWKDHVRHEYQAWRNWPEKWGFITKEYIRMNRRLRGEPVTPDPEDKYFYASCKRGNEVVPDESISRQIQPSDQSLSPSRSGATLKRASAYSNLPGIINGSSWKDKLSPDSTPVNDSILNVTDINSEEAQSERLPLIKPAPPARVARTTAAQIGWRQGSNLERFGKAPNARGYQSILKRFNWPMQGIV